MVTLEQLQEDINELKEDINEIKDALLGNEYHSNGLIYQIKEQGKYIEKDKRLKWMVYGGALALFFILEFGVRLIKV